MGLSSYAVLAGPWKKYIIESVVRATEKKTSQWLGIGVQM